MSPVDPPPETGPDRYAVLGHPVAHSRSPAIHAAFARQTGQRLHYGRVLCPLDGFADAVRAFAAAGGRGVNVTMPFKFDALALAAHATERARLAGAANVLCFDEPGWLADNTDGVGLVDDLRLHAGLDLRGRHVLLLGAGGGGAGVLGPLLAQRPARLVLANRSADKAQALADRHAAWAAAHGVVLQVRPLGDVGGGHDLLVNATAASVQGQAAPVDASALAAGAVAVDLMYGPAAQPFLDWAAAAGATPRDGLGMLVEQAAAAFERWRGVRPDTTPVLAALREQLAHEAAAAAGAPDR